MVHLDRRTLPLGFPDRVQEDVDGTLGRGFGFAVEDGHAKYDAESVIPGLFVLVEHGVLAVQLGLAVQIGRAGGRVGLVGSFAGLTGENVVSREIEEKGRPRRAEPGEGRRSLNVQFPGTVRVPVDLVGEAVGST